jgi:hypothetical protein
VSADGTLLPEAADRRAPRPDAILRTLRPRLRRWQVTAVWLLAVVVAFAAYLRLARTRAVDSDGASQALQAWNMLHGNPLLRGWSLSDVSFYTTELPQYMLVELVRGLNQDVVHVAAAMTYTLTVLLAALLAKGTATGREALTRVLIAAGIMLAPQLSSGVNILVSSPDHIGTSVPVMVTWLILDRTRPRWYIPVIAAALLGWAVVADTLVLYIGVLPLAVVCTVRVWRAVRTEHRPLATQSYYLALGGGPLLTAGLAMVTLRLIHGYGGFFSPAPVLQLAGISSILHQNLPVTGQGLLLLGGADFMAGHPTPATAFTVLHLVGVALAAWAIWLAARRFLHDRDLLTQLLVAGVVINLAAYLPSTLPQSLWSTREIAPVLPFCAALAGRLLASRITAVRLAQPLLLVVLLGYLGGLAYEISQQSVPAQSQRLISWLDAHRLHTGLSGYWQSNVTTLTSGDRVQIRAVTTARGPLAPRGWESDATWYDPRRYRATFVVMCPEIAGYPGFTDRLGVQATFGRPARTYHVGVYTILVWNTNLLARLR